MLKIYKLSISLFLLLSASSLYGQTYCNVNTATPYSANMPGITNFTLNTINRTSLAIENYPSNNYVNTGLSTNLKAGQSYAVSITHTKDAVMMPNVRNNIRIWIDLDQNGSWTDVGETILSVDFNAAGTYNGNITIPATAKTGATKMRVTIKMSSEGGHIDPSPCDIPADPLGYHGEIEDYNVNILAATGISEISNFNSVEVYPNPVQDRINISFALSHKSELSIYLYNVVGEKIATLAQGQILSQGTHLLNFSNNIEHLSSGIYFLKLIDGGNSFTKRLVISK